MKLGVVAEDDRLSDSPDTIVVVEPTVGSVARSKGHLYLLVTARGTGHRLAEATRLAAETIRNEYYYDESAGIRVCIEKAVGQANKRLFHQRDRLGLGHARDPNGPIGVALAVVRGNELYVATVGPAEAYLVRQARLSTLPDPHRERGLPSRDLEPDVWRGEVSVGDSLVLISPNMVAKLGPDELKDALVTLHPQSAVEHLHNRFVAADGSGSDGAIAFEATEVSQATQKRTLVPVRPAEPLAGAPDRSPIPLADPVADGVAAVQASARAARVAAGSVLDRLIFRLQDLLPRRSQPYRRVTPLSAKREKQRRAAIAVLAFIFVGTSLAVGIFAVGGNPTDEARSSVDKGQEAVAQASAALGEVFGDGINLVRSDPRRALEKLTLAYQQLDIAGDAGVPDRTLARYRQQVVAGLDLLYGVTAVASTTLFAFEEVDPPVDLGDLVLGPDGAPYVLDEGTKSVYRIDLATSKATVVLREGQEAGSVTAAEPRFIAVGGPDLVIVDAENVVWRWRPANDAGEGSLGRVRIPDAAGWGNDISAIGTWLRQADLGRYNLYVVDPSEQQILAYAPARDGSGFPADPTPRLATKRPVDGITCMYIDGDIFLAEDGVIGRLVNGRTDDWKAETPGDELLRPAPEYSFITSGSERRQGLIYGYDPDNGRILAFDKAEGDYIEQYILAREPAVWEDIRGLYVVPGVDDEPATLVWATEDAIHQSELVAIPTSSGGSPSPGASPSGSGGQGSDEPDETEEATPSDGAP